MSGGAHPQRFRGTTLGRGGVAERFNAAALKAVDRLVRSGGSNPSPSALVAPAGGDDLGCRSAGVRSMLPRVGRRIGLILVAGAVLALLLAGPAAADHPPPVQRVPGLQLDQAPEPP